MSSKTEQAVLTYAAAVEERDRAKRLELIDACFAADGRFVTGGTEFTGRAALARLLDTFRDDPRGLEAVILGTVDCQGSLFRFRNAVVHPDGTSVEGFDAGVVDADGRISLLLTFAGALA
jgi:hypothetical protein